MENVNTAKKKWGRKSLYALGALVGAYLIPYAVIELSLFLTLRADRMRFLQWHEGGRVGPLPIDFSSFPELAIAAVLGLVLAGVAVYFSWRAINRTREGAERGWSLSVLTLALSAFSLLFFILTVFSWFGSV